MIVHKCKMCGGETTLDSKNGTTLCEYCGSEFSLDDGDHETIHRIVDEAKVKELEIFQKREEIEKTYREKKEKSVFKTKIVLLAIWLTIVVILYVLSACTTDNVGFSPYQLLLIPVTIFGIVIIIKEIIKFFRNN